MIEISDEDAEKIIKFYTAGYFRYGRRGAEGAAVATHTMSGNCPEHSRDRDRDEECPACQTLMAVEKALANKKDSKDDVLDKILDGKW
jgi:hypothetical protein